jgi:hypothetical protein
VVCALILLSSTNTRAAETEVLFVANGYYDQEDDIVGHLGDLGFYNVTVKKDYQVYGVA